MLQLFEMLIRIANLANFLRRKSFFMAKFMLIYLENKKPRKLGFDGVVIIFTEVLLED